MRWFDHSWLIADDAEASRIVVEYRRHLESLAPTLPASFRVLAEAGGSISLHDGQILSIFFEHDSGDTVVLDTYAGEDIPPDPSLISALHVRIVYHSAVLVAPTLGELRALIRSPKTAILDGEVDRTNNGRFEHRLSLWTGKRAPLREVAVQFNGADVVPVRFQGTTATLIGVADASGATS